eukprot:683217-Prymnesium_polylepis.1
MSDEDYDFEYSDDDQEEEDVNIENQYYNSKGLLDSDVDAALQGFRDVVTMEEEKGEWGFKVRVWHADAALRWPSLLRTAAAEDAPPPGLCRVPRCATCACIIGIQADGEAAIQAEKIRRHDGRIQRDAHLYQWEGASVPAIRKNAPVRSRGQVRPRRPHRSAVTRNYSEKVINKVLDLVSGSHQMDLLQTFYETTLVALQAKQQPRLTASPLRDAPYP